SGGHLLCFSGPKSTLPLPDVAGVRNRREFSSEALKVGHTSPSSPSCQLQSSVSCAALLGRSSKSSSTCQRGAGQPHFSGPTRHAALSSGKLNSLKPPLRERENCAFDRRRVRWGWREVAALKVFFGPTREMLAREGRAGEVAGVAVADGVRTKGDKNTFSTVRTGELVLAAKLDFRAPAAAPAPPSGPSTSATRRISSTAVVTVRVLDENDNGAQFLSDVYKRQPAGEPGAGVPPGRQPDRHRRGLGRQRPAGVQHRVGQLAAAVLAGHEHGRLFARKKADREAKDFYRLTVLATDYGNPADDWAEVRIRCSMKMIASRSLTRREYRFVMQIDDKGNVSQQPYLNRYADAFQENAGSDGGPAADGSVLHVSDCDAPPNGGPFSWSLVDAVATASLRRRPAHSLWPGETVCAHRPGGPADASLLPSNLTAVLAYPAAGGEKLGRLRLRHPSPKDARLRLLSHSDLFSLAPNGELSVAMATTRQTGCTGFDRGLASEQEVRVRVTLLTEAMAESACRCIWAAGARTASSWTGGTRSCGAADGAAAARRGRSGAPAGCAARLWGGERQRQLMALLAVYEESRRGFLDPAEVRSRLNSSEAVRSLLPEGAGLAAEARRDRRLLVETAGITFTAPEFRLAPTCGTAKLKGAPPSGAVFGFFPGGSEGGEGAAWALAEWQQLRGLELRLRTRQSRPGRLLRVSGCGGWRLALRLHADGDGRLEATAAVSGGGGTEDRDGPELLRLVSPRPVNDGAWHRVLLRLHDGSPYWTLELLTDSIEPQLGQLPALTSLLPFILGPGLDSASRTGPICRLPHRPAVLAGGHPTDGQRRLRLRPRLGAAARRPSWRRPARRRPRRRLHGGRRWRRRLPLQLRAALRRAALRAEPAPCDHRPCLNGGACRDFGDGRAADSPATARLGRPDRAASWWTAAAAERRPHLVEVEAPANTAAGAWAAAAAARAPAMLGLCDRDVDECRQAVGLCDGGRGVLRQPAGRVQVGGRRIWCECPSVSPDRPASGCPAKPGAAIDGGASASEQPLLLGLRFHELAAVLGCVSSLLLLALAVFCLVSCYGKRQARAAQARRRRRRLPGRPWRGGDGADADDGAADDQRQLRRPGGLADVRRLRDAAAAAANAAVNADRQLRAAGRALPVLLRLLRLGRRRPMSPQKPPPLLSFPRSLLRRRRSGRPRFSGELVDDQGELVDDQGELVDDQGELATARPAGGGHGAPPATLGGLGASRGPGNPPDLIMDGGPFSVSYFGGAGCRQTSAASASSPSNASTSTSAAASAPPLVVIGCGGGGSGFGGFGAWRRRARSCG
uniref:Cadherin domain-containing protein n=1 Tax=Macrostomum lignano TaxID=282301 RepID=A0A1I8FBF2_9PLAT